MLWFRTRHENLSVTCARALYEYVVLRQFGLGVWKAARRAFLFAIGVLVFCCP